MAEDKLVRSSLGCTLLALAHFSYLFTSKCLCQWARQSVVAVVIVVFVALVVVVVVRWLLAFATSVDFFHCFAMQFLWAEFASPSRICLNELHSSFWQSEFQNKLYDDYQNGQTDRRRDRPSHYNIVIQIPDKAERSLFRPGCWFFDTL